MRSQRSRPRLVEVEDLDNSQHLCSLTWYSISLISNIDFTCVKWDASHRRTGFERQTVWLSTRNLLFHDVS
jgi:hypothetical protein